MLLELAPRDPRSLFQGDYMSLRYAITGDEPGKWPRDGLLQVTLDADSVVRSYRLHGPGAPLGPDEHLLRYRRRAGAIRLGPDAFFFQEGSGSVLPGEVRRAAGGRLRGGGPRRPPRREPGADRPALGARP